MAWVLPALTAVSAVAGLGSAALNSGRTNNQAIQKSNYANAGLGEAQDNAQYMRMLSALINQRSVAGSVDEAGTSMRYDPATNQWVSELGKLPREAQTASDQASISRNTTDLRQAQAANAQAAIRAARGEGYADTTRRNLEDFRPTSGSEMAGLLGEQATRASNATYTPLIADTLRQFARTGTSAGPVLAELGKSSAGNLRDSLIEAQLKGRSGADQLNQSRRADLSGAAQTGASLATPGFGYSQINPSSYSSTMAALLGQRANTGAIAPAYGATGVNAAAKDVQTAYGTAGGAVPDPNFGLNQTQRGLQEAQTAFGKGGAVQEGLNAYNAYQNTQKNTPAAIADDTSLWGNQGMYGPVTRTNSFG
jgi:hypothetical protein